MTEASRHPATPGRPANRRKHSRAGSLSIRGHGPEGNYSGRYPVRVLRGWAKSALSWTKEGRDVFVYFDQKAAAPADAQRLIEIVKTRDEQFRLLKMRSLMFGKCRRAGARRDTQRTVSPGES